MGDAAQTAMTLWGFEPVEPPAWAPDQCKLCAHPLVEDIDVDVLAGMSASAAGNKWGVAPDLLRRHMQHMSRVLAEARHAKEATRADRLLVRILELDADAKRVMDEVLPVDGPGSKLKAIQLRLKITETLARVTGYLKPMNANVTNNTLVVQTSPELAKAMAEDVLATQLDNGNMPGPPPPPILDLETVDAEFESVPAPPAAEKP